MLHSHVLLTILNTMRLIQTWPSVKTGQHLYKTGPQGVTISVQIAGCLVSMYVLGDRVVHRLDWSGEGDQNQKRHSPVT